MDALIEFANSHIIPHWPFFAWFLVATLCGEVFKRTLWTKYNSIHKKPHWFWWWMRKTMVLHPVVVGILISFVWTHPEEGVDGLPAASGYFALSGALSVWGFELIKGIFKKKVGVEIELAGLSDPPSADDK